MRPRRLPGFSYLGCYRYSITCRTDGRYPAFRDPEAVQIAKDAFAASAIRQGFELLLYCYMPDHLHLLAAGRHARSDFRAFISGARRRAGSDHRRRNARELWQHGYHERVLRRDQDTLALARYVAMNPVRAGLADHPLAYPFTGSSVFSLESLLLDCQPDRRRR